MANHHWALCNTCGRRIPAWFKVQRCRNCVEAERMAARDNDGEHTEADRIDEGFRMLSDDMGEDDDEGNC